MAGGLDHAPQVTYITPQSDSGSESYRTAKRMGKVRDKIVTATTGLVKEPEKDTSAWYMRTGEGGAIAAGSEELNRVDIDTVFGDKFTLALESVIEVGNGEAGPDKITRLDEVQQAYKRKLTTKPRPRQQR